MKTTSKKATNSKTSTSKGYTETMTHIPMTKAEALNLFREIDNSPRGDTVRRRKAWNNFTDDLYKDRQITSRQYDTWTNPF